YVREALEQLLLPAECTLCHTLLSFSRSRWLVCEICRHRWRAVRPPWCGRCGQPEPLFGPCRLCAAWPAALRAARSAVWLEGGARDAVHALKYRGLARIADDLASAMEHIVLPECDRAWPVPVPLGAKRLRERGYNPRVPWSGLAHARSWPSRSVGPSFPISPEEQRWRCAWASTGSVGSGATCCAPRS